MSDASMRPPEFTGGNMSLPFTSEKQGLPPRFNEAAGIHRRKPGARYRLSCAPYRSFNEAAGIHRRKHTGQRLTD